jgi:hypothetical protein
MVQIYEENMSKAVLLADATNLGKMDEILGFWHYVSSVEGLPSFY